MRFLFTVALFVILGSLLAQPKPNDLKKLEMAESSLRETAMLMFLDSTEDARRSALRKFIPELVSTLQIKSSYDYPFDSLRGISIVKPKDNSFRMFTWQFVDNMGNHRYYGAIQLYSDKELQLIPLFDASDTMAFQTQQILGSKNWFGATYYKLMEHKVKGKKYYTLFGYDGGDRWTKRKILEVLHFEDQKPVFGAPLFEFVDTTGNVTKLNRFFLEYKNDATVRLNYNQDRQQIVYDHITPFDERYQGLQFTYIPDGTYEGFEFKKGKWNWVEKIFHYAINHPDKPPMPAPKLDNRD